MKKLLVIFLFILLSFPLLGNRAGLDRAANRADYEFINDLKTEGYTFLPEIVITAYRNPQDTLKKSNYERYWEEKEGIKARPEPKKEWDDLYFNAKTDGQPQMKKKKNKKPYVDPIEIIVDSLRAENPNITINNYYDNDPFYFSHNISRFYHGGFNYWMYSNPWYYSNNYWMYDSYDWYWEMRFRPYWYGSNFYFGYNYYNPWRYNYWGPYYGYNHYNHYNYRGYNNFSHQYASNQGGGSLSRPQYGRRERPSNYTSNDVIRGAPVQNNSRVNTPERRISTTTQRAAYSESRRSYSPTYESPRLSVRPQYNNSRTSTPSMRSEQPSRSQNMGATNRTVSSTPQNRTYSAPTRREYSAPVQNRTYSAPPQSRSDFSNSSSRSYNSGSSFSGSNSSSSGSSGGGSRSSSGSSGSSSGSSGGSSSGRR